MGLRSGLTLHTSAVSALRFGLISHTSAAEAGKASNEAITSIRKSLQGKRRFTVSKLPFPRLLRRTRRSATVADEVKTTLGSRLIAAKHIRDYFPGPVRLPAVRLEEFSPIGSRHSKRIRPQALGQVARDVNLDGLGGKLPHPSLEQTLEETADLRPPTHAGMVRRQQVRVLGIKISTRLSRSPAL
jgi:hypothetical protein